jgi:hypothetical protein
MTCTVIPFLSSDGHGQMVIINRYFNKVSTISQQKTGIVEMVMPW